MLDNNVRDLEEIKREANSPQSRKVDREKEEMLRRISFLENKLAR